MARFRGPRQRRGLLCCPAEHREEPHGPDPGHRPVRRRHAVRAAAGRRRADRVHRLHRLRRRAPGRAWRGGDADRRARDRHCLRSPRDRAVRWRGRARSGAGLAVRHGGACARLRRHGPVGTSERGPGPRHPGAGRRGGRRRPRPPNDRRLRGRLRSVGGADRPRPGTAPPQGMAPVGRVRDDRGGCCRVRPARARCRPGHQCGGARRLARRRSRRELRHHDQAVPGRARGAVGPRRGAARRRRADGLGRCPRASTRLPHRVLAQRRRSTARARRPWAAHGASSTPA